MGKFYHSQKLKPGYRLLRPLQDSSGRVLLESGTVLTERYLELIEQWGLQELFLLAERPAKGPAFVEVTRTHIIDTALQTAVTEVLADVFESVENTQVLAMDRIYNSASLLVREILSHQQVALDLSVLRTLDENTFNHSLSVSVYATAAGVELGLSEPELMRLAVAALLHDIGKMKIPLSIINKPGPLNAVERKIIEEHPRLGLELLQEKSELAPEILQGVYEHHERCDGNGYPHALTDDQISQFGKIVAVADFYDALVSDRAYRAALPPFLVLEQLSAASLTQFNPEIVKAFVRSVAPYPIGTRVVLDSGEQGEVIGYDRRMPSRPRVLVTHDVTKHELRHPYECDLLQQLNRFIVKVG